MTEGIRSYLMSICAAAVLLSLVETIVPKGNVRKVAGLIGGLLLLLVVISPVARLTERQIREAISQVMVEREAIETGIQTGNRELQAELIKQRCTEYILDKAARLGASVTVELELSQEGSYPYPVQATVKGIFTQAQREALSMLIENDLGIPPEQQKWSGS